MIEETARVTSTNQQWVNVVTTQSSSCHQCSEKSSCSTSVLSKYFGNKSIELTLHSTLELKEGDEVTVGIEEKVFLGLTALVYFVPLGGLLLSAVLGQYIGNQLNIGNELPTVLFAISGFIGCYLGINRLIERYIEPQNFKPVILKKL